MGGSAQPQFGDPLQGLTPDQLARFQTGKADFVAAEDVPGGLGPVFNDTACVNCHTQAAIGGGSDRLETRYGQVINGVFNPLTQFDGTLVHAKGIGRFNGVDFVGEVVPPEANVVAERRVNPLFGLGLVDAVPDQFLKDIAQFEQDFTPATAGRVNVVTDVASGQPVVGRFGWKCQIGTVLTFAANAYQNEMGITTPFFPHENPPQGDVALLAANPALTNPNDTNETPMKFADFITFLAPPPQLAPDATGAARGGHIPCRIGCADCHLPAMRTGPNEVAALNNVVFFPFSDFLLHDMGTLTTGSRNRAPRATRCGRPRCGAPGSGPASSTMAAPRRSRTRSSPTTARAWRPATSSPILTARKSRSLLAFINSL